MFLQSYTLTSVRVNEESERIWQETVADYYLTFSSIHLEGNNGKPQSGYPVNELRFVCKINSCNEHPVSCTHSQESVKSENTG
jgi:hypothetical protein